MDNSMSMNTYGFGAFGAVMCIVLVAIYILQATAMFKLYQKANINHPWLAYIPIAQLWPFFWAIKKSAWNILWFLLPFLGAAIGTAILVGFQDSTGFIIYVAVIIIFSIIPIVLNIMWTVRFFKAFNMSPLWLLGLIGFLIPFINYLIGIGFIVLYCYMGFSSKVKYNPDFDAKNT
ncbi:uncharacterized membrane protein YhaH (DUF805 family) [Scopulibacillus daqui]|uniref:Uncharacterized membrane protein YhaH (DUF805 family) n=1 Tax=Scopulibacillus daqui TaxID=1469162 RepID=A0ABS2PWS1_9BACL|nr:hypothetical protein [Scopulibacillus daqui]MBM7644491.1 uncharacterized membrane protein YhaH (DUF805 family) [Scopulibacillus daqui]